MRGNNNVGRRKFSFKKSRGKNKWEKKIDEGKKIKNKFRFKLNMNFVLP